MEPQIRFCTSADGSRIAYATLGDGPPTMQISAWGTNIELDWQAGGRGWYEDITRSRRLVWLDRRGTGASQRDVSDFSLEAHVADVTAIVDHLGFERFDVIGPYDGAAISIAYAAQNPHRVDRLVLTGAYVSGGESIQPEELHSMLELIRGNWRMARRAIVDAALPNGPIELQKTQSRILRESMSPEVAAEYMEFQGTLDVRQYLSKVEAPTLVIARRDVRIAPIGAARAVAALIPDARFVALEGDVATGYFDHEQWVTPITEFLDEGRAYTPTAERGAGAFRTILFTDVVGSTALTDRLGDARARDLLREHERMTREALKAHGGSEIKTMGDGFMASFGSATKALECAVALQRAFGERNEGAQQATPLRIRIGVNAGEPIAEDDPGGRGDLFGTAVNMAARVAAKADGGEILVSDVVRQLVAGKKFLFNDRGETELRGFEDPVRIYELRWESSE